ncbi:MULTISPECIES: hypothetical protein [unclassified Streptomyces]|uniref:hypothetical protein n=1 Tax=unclassified Streptomyces TaxID=2593676 RepID=UPI0027418AB9|nr:MULTISPECIES: hypothetical protein [unclassified Streptomyces]
MGIKQRVAGAAVAAAAVLGAGFAAAPAQAQTAAAHSCPYKAICVHMHHAGKSDWTWKNYWSCNDFYLGSWVPTSYINHQTHGTRAKFKDRGRHVIQTTPGAYSKGAVKYPYSTYYVRPC